MWPLPKISNESIVCICTPQAISLSFITTQNNQAIFLDYKRIAMTTGELEYGILCNPTTLKKVVNEFINTHNKTATVHIAIAGKYIHEKITNKETLINTAQYKTYLYTNKDKPFYYIAHINPALIMQYQLLSIQMKINLSSLSTIFSAQLALYQHAKGSSFRATELLHDLQLYNHRFEEYFNQHHFLKMVQHDFDTTIDLVKEQNFLLSSLGLFYARR